MDLSDSFSVIYGMIQDLANAPDGLSNQDFRERYNISPNTVRKYINILTTAGVPIYDDRQKYYLDGTYFAPFSLTIEESELLYLALSRSITDYVATWSTTRTLLNKLAGRLPELLSSQLLDRYRGYNASSSDKWFSLLAQAKQRHREVWVDYHPLNRERPSRWRLRPMGFISNALSDGFYVLGEGIQDGEDYLPLSFKFNRILHVEITDVPFTIESAAHTWERKTWSWGVWHSNQPPQKVVLRFEPRHYDRLLESMWHLSQNLHADESGYVYFTVDVSEPLEMIPWIRSWGSGVVVIEPDILRQRIINSLQRQLKAYGLQLSPRQEETDPISYLWAKYDRRSGDYHLLICHMMDVAAVAYEMWESILSESQKAWIQDILQTDADHARNTVALLAGLHDIGKASAAFQSKSEILYAELIQAFPQLTQERRFEAAHGVVSAVILKHLLPKLGLSEQAALKLAGTIGGHHGQWISHVELRNGQAAAGRTQWPQIQESLFESMVKLLHIETITLTDEEEVENLFATFLSGFVSVCDWLGSDSTFFPYTTHLQSSETYFTEARDRARAVLVENGWFAWRDQQDTTFEEVFPFAPNVFQAAAIEAFVPQARPPKLILIEYETGGGKTELALYLANKLVSLYQLFGVYVAMPTQATSNQMFARVRDYVQSAYPGQAINMQLIHGQADMHPLYQNMETRPSRDGDTSQVVAAEWFQNRKRALLAPFAVGTVDQTMLSVLQARHHFVRQFALSHKVILFDEVHAYDAYMNAIIYRLVEWLSQLGSSMILLSATLPKKDRETLIHYAGAENIHLDDVGYPRMTIVTATNEVQVHPLPMPPSKTIAVDWIDASMEALFTYVRSIYDEGGCIAIICNTVDEAINTTQALKTAAFDDVWLFHARFPPAWRIEIEERVLQAFGKNGERPQRMILVATQIIEQSLDIDFDLLITRTAPIDLLIQRMGRVHRHERNDATRPSSLAEPHLVLRSPLMENGIPSFEIDEWVYQRYILLMTWLLLHQRQSLILPDEIDTVMEFVYGYHEARDRVSSIYREALEESFVTMTQQNDGQAFRGEIYTIGSPQDEFLIGRTSYDLSDDDRLNIRTRDIRPGIDIICVGGGSMLPALNARKPTYDEVRILLRHRVTVRSYSVKEALEVLPKYSYWERIPQLRDARPIKFDANHAAIPNSPYQLRLTQEFGLEIIKDD